VDIFGPDAATDIAKIRRQLTFNLSLFRLLVVVGLDAKMKGANWMNGTQGFNASLRHLGNIQQ
jgi:hypothetical protein